MGRYRDSVEEYIPGNFLNPVVEEDIDDFDDLMEEDLEDEEDLVPDSDDVPENFPEMDNAPQIGELFNAPEMILPVPDEAVPQGEDDPNVQQFRYQLPGYLVQCAVQSPEQEDLIHHQVMLHSPEILLRTNGDNIMAFVAPNQNMPQQNALEAGQFHNINEGNSVRNQGYLYLAPPNIINAPGNPGSSGSIIVLHEQILFAPSNVRFGPITRMNTRQVVSQQDDNPRTPSEFGPQESDDENEILVDDEADQKSTEKEQDPEVTTSVDEAIEEKIDIEKVEDSENEPKIPSTDNNESDKDRSNDDEKMGSEKEEASSTADLTTQQTSDLGEMEASKGGDQQGNQQAAEPASIPQVLRNGGMWVLPPGMQIPIRISGGPDKLADWVIQHAGQNYGLVRGMKPNSQQQKSSNEEERNYLDFWPLEFEVEPFAELERQLGVIMPQSGRSNDDDSAEFGQETINSGAGGSNEENIVEKLYRKNQAQNLEDEMEKEKTEEQ